jgi:hypothetical protein
MKKTLQTLLAAGTLAFAPMGMAQHIMPLPDRIQSTQSLEETCSVVNMFKIANRNVADGEDAVRRDFLLNYLNNTNPSAVAELQSNLPEGLDIRNAQSLYVNLPVQGSLYTLENLNEIPEGTRVTVGFGYNGDDNLTFENPSTGAILSPHGQNIYSFEISANSAKPLTRTILEMACHVPVMERVAEVPNMQPTIEIDNRVYVLQNNIEINVQMPEQCEICEPTYVEVPKETIVEREVIREIQVPVETIVEKEVIREVQVPIYVDREVIREVHVEPEPRGIPLGYDICAIEATPHYVKGSIPGIDDIVFTEVTKDTCGLHSAPYGGSPVGAVREFHLTEVYGSPEAVARLKNQRISFQMWPANGTSLVTQFENGDSNPNAAKELQIVTQESYGDSGFAGAAGAVNLGRIVLEFGYGNDKIMSGPGDTIMYFPTDSLPIVPYRSE